MLECAIGKVRESEQAGLKLNIQKTKIMASGPITSCQIDGKQWKQWQSLFWGVQRLRFHFHALEKEMAAHSSILAWRIPGTTEPGGLPSVGSHRVGHDWCDLAAAAAAKSLQVVTAAMKLRRLLLGRKVMTNLDSILKSRDITLPSQGYGFSSGHVWM